MVVGTWNFVARVPFWFVLFGMKSFCGDMSSWSFSIGTEDVGVSRHGDNSLGLLERKSTIWEAVGRSAGSFFQHDLIKFSLQLMNQININDLSIGLNALVSFLKNIGCDISVSKYGNSRIVEGIKKVNKKIYWELKTAHF